MDTMLEDSSSHLKLYSQCQPYVTLPGSEKAQIKLVRKAFAEVVTHFPVVLVGRIDGAVDIAAIKSQPHKGQNAAKHWQVFIKGFNRCPYEQSVEQECDQSIPE